MSFKRIFGFSNTSLSKFLGNTHQLTPIVAFPFSTLLSEGLSVSYPFLGEVRGGCKDHFNVSLKPFLLSFAEIVKIKP